MTSAADVLQMIKDNDCKYVDLRVTDLLGKEMHLTIPADKIDEDTFELGQPFDGSSFVGWRGIESSDMLLQPDPSTARMDPFREANTLVLNCDVPLNRRPARAMNVIRVRSPTVLKPI